MQEEDSQSARSESEQEFTLRSDFDEKLGSTDVHQIDGAGETEEEEVYDTLDFVSGPTFSPESTFEKDALELDYSYGYDCQNPNLCVIDPETLLWYTGNIIHIFNTKKQYVTFRRSALGQDISFIVRSKTGKEFAVGENGAGYENSIAPMIIVYEWPGLEVKAVLKGGAICGFKSLDFSSDGMKLVSQAGPPDNTLTIWNLKEKKSIISFQNPNPSVAKALFSPYDTDTFVTCGSGHIKFWRLIETFTGLKIEGTLGRFGEVENNDVTTLHFFPDGRVLSNFCGGNLAIWRPNAFLELDLSMKSNENCHSDTITFIQTYFEDSHVYTAGLDGKVRVWNYSYITSFYNDDQQYSTHVDIEPSYERAIKDSKGKIGFPLEMLPKDSLSYPYHYYVQDAKGGIWLLDLELKKHPDPWTQLYSCHSGPIFDLSPSPAEYYFASLGAGGRMNVYSHQEKTLVLSKEFDSSGTSVLWLPTTIDPTGKSIILGFSTGVLRLVAVSLKALYKGENNNGLSVLQVLKPHSSSILILTVHRSSPIMLSGSTDKTVFIYGLSRNETNVNIEPLGMIRVPAPVSHIAWNIFRKDEKVFMVSCNNGKSVEIKLEDHQLESAKTNPDDRETYILNFPMRITNAKSRSQMKEKRYFSKYMAENLIWIEETSTEHRYHNYIYEIEGEPVEKLNISEGNAVNCYADLNESNYLVLGLNNGRIKVIKVNPEEPFIFSDSWEIVMHKTQNHTITKICFSYDNKVMYSCGTDSAIFAYNVNLDGMTETPHNKLPCDNKLPEGIKTEIIPALSLEEAKLKNKKELEEKEHQLKVENFKNTAAAFLDEYCKLIEINKSLPKCLRIPKSFFRLETREEREQEKKKIEAKEEETLKPLKEKLEKLTEKVSKIQKHFIDPIKTPKFYQFAVRAPHYLKSFPERRLFTKDPLGETEEDEIERRERIKLAAGGDSEKEPEKTEFERMLDKINTRRNKERERDDIYEQTKSKKTRTEIHDDESENDEVPDLITAAGEFLCEYNKFTLTERQAFRRINTNRLKRLNCRKEIEKLKKLTQEWHYEHGKIKETFENLKKAEKKNKEKLPQLTNKLYDLLQVRKLIYLKKECFNKKMLALRSEKSNMINHYYWLQEEYRYMAKDMKRWGMDLGGMEIPSPLEVVWDLEYPGVMKYEPGPMPFPFADRMESYEMDLQNMDKLIPLDALGENPNLKRNPLFSLFRTRQEKFKNSIVEMKETLDQMIRDYDKQFLPLLLERSKISTEVTELKSYYNSVLQEVDIIYRYDILLMSVSYYKHEILKIKYIHILRQNIRKKKMNEVTEQVKECNRTIDDLNVKFAETLRDEKWAKILERTYKRKYKEPQRKSSKTSDESSGSASDYDESDSILSATSSVGMAYLYDETIMPPGCDEDKFEQTFRLREQRHVEENKITELSRVKELIARENRTIRKQILVADVLLALFYAGTFRYVQMMRNELDEIEYMVQLHPSQIQIFPKNNLQENEPIFEECKLVEEEDYLAKVKTAQDLKNLIEEINKMSLKTQKLTKLKVKELESLTQIQLTTEKQIKKLLEEKYGDEVDVDGVQTHVLLEMIKNTMKRCASELTEIDRRKKIKQKKQIATKSKEEIQKLKKERLKTLHTLYTIEAEKNRITADKLAHQRKGVTKKLNLSEERDSLLKELKDVEEVEEKLKALLKDG